MRFLGIPVLVRVSGLLVCGLILSSLMGSLAFAQDDSQYKRLILAAGDSLAVRFSAQSCSGDLAKGVAPQAEAAEDKIISGLVVVKEGAPVVVKIVEAKDNGRAGKAGKLVVEFVSVEAADGAIVPLGGGDPLTREGKGKGIILKVVTLFLIKGGEPCLDMAERFYPHIKETTSVYLEP